MADRSALAERPAWWLCTKSSDNRFTKGMAYEVFHYDSDGHAVVITNGGGSEMLPTKHASFVPHNPWGGTDHG